MECSKLKGVYLLNKNPENQNFIMAMQRCISDKFMYNARPFILQDKAVNMFLCSPGPKLMFPNQTTSTGVLSVLKCTTLVDKHV